jgi:hypothetical protein
LIPGLFTLGQKWLLLDGRAVKAAGVEYKAGSFPFKALGRARKVGI